MCFSTTKTVQSHYISWFQTPQLSDAKLRVAHTIRHCWDTAKKKSGQYVRSNWAGFWHVPRSECTLLQSSDLGQSWHSSLRWSPWVSSQQQESHVGPWSGSLVRKHTQLHNTVFKHCHYDLPCRINVFCLYLRPFWVSGACGWISQSFTLLLHMQHEVFIMLCVFTAVEECRNPSKDSVLNVLSNPGNTQKCEGACAPVKLGHCLSTNRAVAACFWTPVWQVSSTRIKGGGGNASCLLHHDLHVGKSYSVSNAQTTQMQNLWQAPHTTICLHILFPVPHHSIA